LPLVIAGSIAILVVVGAVMTHLVRTDLAPEKQSAVDACEAEYASSFPSGPGIIGGDIYAATEWADLQETLVRLGFASAEELSGEEKDVRDHQAETLTASGGDTMTLVWQLDDQSNAMCVADLQDGKVTNATIVPLVEPVASPSPSPTT